MVRRIVSLAPVILFALSAIAQDKPYFQQEVNYTINVKLDDVKHELTGDEKIVYINNSPDELSFIYFHLWPNAYKNNKTALAKQLLSNGETKFHYADEGDKGYIDQLDFKVDGKPVNLEYDPEHIDIAKIILNTPLKPGDKIEITTPFHVKIPLGEFSRLGHISQQYQVTQWYPKPAVYDRNGWNQMPYLDQGEFYSEFGTFDVHITLPKNYVVGATGDLVDGEKEMTWLNAKVKETQEKVSFDSKDVAFPASDAETKTLHYHQERVHDFAWFADKRYNVLRGEVTLPNTSEKVTTWVMFTNQFAHLWKNSIPYMNDAIYYYSLWNGDYPYKHATAVDGALSAGGGMEYPNVTVIGAVNSPMILETVIMHEVGHNWFYGILASNEREHPWMDEGLNSFNEHRYLETKYPEATLVGGIAGAGAKGIEKAFHLDQYKHKEQYYLTYLVSARRNEDQPIEHPSAEYTSLNYGGVVYSKTAMVFDYLMAYLGEDMMNKAMHTYFDTWKFKHPQPEDLRAVLERVSGKDLSWFFDDIIKTTKKLDYKIKDVKKNADGTYSITVKNTGDIKGPVSITGVKDEKLQSIAWYDGFEGKKELSLPAGDYDYFMIDYTSEMPEVNRNNNTMYRKGLFKKTEPLSLQFLGSLDDPKRTQLFFTPVAGWNRYNGFMAGVALYNNILPQKKLEYVFMPMYGFNNKDIAGSGSIRYNMLTDKGPFRQISMGVNGSRYAYNDYPFITSFNKIAPELVFDIKKKRLRSHISHSVRIRSVNIIRDDFYYLVPQYITVVIPVKEQETYMINNLTYTMAGKHPIHPYSAAVDVEHGDGMAKASVTLNQKISYTEKNSLNIRLFGGAFLDEPDDMARNDYRFRLAGWRGYQDYMYDHVFLGRTETSGTLSRQFAEEDGGFKAGTGWGQSREWIAAMNLKLEVPILSHLPLVPVKLFADIGATGDDGLPKSFVKDGYLYDAGFFVDVAGGVLEVYFPLAYSDAIKEGYKVNGMNTLGERVRFTLNLHTLNPFEKLRNLF